MVRQGDHVELYSWDQANSKWTKVGDVVGSSGGNQVTSGKTLFDGKVSVYYNALWEEHFFRILKVSEEGIAELLLRFPE